jgi:hypothetical protein
VLDRGTAAQTVERLHDQEPSGVVINASLLQLAADRPGAHLGESLAGLRGQHVRMVGEEGDGILDCGICAPRAG